MADSRKRERSQLSGAIQAVLPESERFEIISRLGEGGMGKVYLAHDRELGTEVAIKMLQRVDASNLYRFKKEFRSLANVSHENLVVLHELICEDSHWLLVMEYVDGIDFLSYLHRLDASDWEVSQPTLEITEEQRKSLTPGTSAGPATPHSSGIVPTLGGYTVARMRDAFGQLACGVQALHDAGKLHMDLKPSNVLVTREGRVVLLDFGMVDDRSLQSAYATIDEGVFGTPAYMAPEQAAGQPAGEAADWYSFGVMLYEALTGRLPIEGGALDIVMRKQNEDPVPPSELVANVPPELERLCMQLLDRDPTKRPAGTSVAASVHPSAPPARAPLRPAYQQGELFVGREAELRTLRSAFDATADGKPVCVALEGPSGIGKSALVRHFTRTLRDGSDTVVLEGRCHERESVPFKAVDSVVDALARYLVLLPPGECAPLLPRNAHVLSRLFPVLLQVPAFKASPARHAVRDPGEVRRRGFGALKELLARIADRHPLVVCIDDLQWGDADSAALLAHVLGPPDPAALLLLVTSRSDLEREVSVLDRLENVDMRRVDLPALAPHEARMLAQLQLGDGARADGALEAVARESEGNPFFVGELVRSLLRRQESGREQARAPISLERTLGERIDAMPRGAVGLLEVVAVAGRPLRQGVALHAAGLSAGDSTFWSSLRSASLVTTQGAGTDCDVDCSHSRVREAVLAQLSPAALRDCHARLAHALEADGRADAESLAYHHEGAGDSARAARYMLRAAQAASEGLAFGRAARLYRWLLSTTTSTTDALGRSELEQALGAALANAGQGAEAAAAFLRAREGAPRAQALELERLAAEHYLRSGHVEEGLESFERVLSAVGMRLPRSPAHALASLLLRRVRLRMRGMRFVERSEAEVPAELLIRIDTCWCASSGLGLIDFVRGGDFQTRHLLFALEAGEPFRVVRALSMEAGYLAADGSRSAKQTAAVVALAREMAERIDDGHAQGLSVMADGMAHWHLGKWRKSVELLQEAELIFRERCTGATWEVATSHMFQAAAQYWLGELRTLAQEGAQYLHEAIQNGDRYAASDLQTGYHLLPALMRDEVEQARRTLEEQKRIWSRKGFHLQHWNQLFADCAIALYQGDGVRALELLDATWPDLERSLVLQVQAVRIEAYQLQAHCLLAAAVNQPRLRTRLLKRARRIAKRIRGEQLPWAAGLVHVIDGSVHELRGDMAAARASFAQAQETLTGQDMALLAAGAGYRLGRLQDDSAGQALMAAATRAFADQGAVRPERMIAVLAPGF